MNGWMTDSDGNLQIRLTWGWRYDCLGIPNYIRKHAGGRNRLRVLDVGCSAGKALARCQSRLRDKYGLKLYTIGIDVSAKMAPQARANLDEFICKDVLDAECDECDAVILANVLLCVDAGRRRAIIGRCAQFLKPGGILITDGVSASLKDELPSLDHRIKRGICAGNVMSSLFYRVFGRLFDTGRMVSVGKGDAQKYAM